MIKIGESPEDSKKLNKFIAKSGDGMRGLVLAQTKNLKQAIILALNSSVKNDVKWGKLYLVKEKDKENYPEVVKQVEKIPFTTNWSINKNIV